MDSHHTHSPDDEYPHLDKHAFARMIEKSIGLGEPTEIERQALSETVSYRQAADTEAARQASQTIYNILLPKKIQEVKDEEIFQNFRPPTAGLDDPMLMAPAKSNDPFSASASQASFRKSTSTARGLSMPRDSTATLLWGKKRLGDAPSKVQRLRRVNAPPYRHVTQWSGPFTPTW